MTSDKTAIVCGAGIVSGKEIMVLELIGGLLRERNSVEVVTSSWGSLEFRRRCEGVGLRPHVMRLGFLSSRLSWNDVRMTGHQVMHWPGLLRSYRRFLSETRPQKVVHTNWHHLLLLFPFLKKDRDLFWVHEVIPNRPQYRRFFTRLSRRIGLFVAVSHAVERALLELGIPADQVRVIYNGIRDPAGEHAPANVDSQTLGIVGQIGPWKGHEDLLEAFRIVVGANPDARLQIFGTGAEAFEAKLRGRADQLGIERFVVWRHFVEDIKEIYRNIGILVVPSKFVEPFGLTAVEAGFFRVPVVASRRGGLSEIIEDDVTGYLFEVGDVGQLAQYLLSLLRNAGLREKMGRKARDRVTLLFSHERFVREFCQMLGLKDQ